MTNFLEVSGISHKLKNLDLPSLRLLAEEIRVKIIDSVIECGGHLSSSLGAVELIIALHFVFDLPKDKLIFDVGHQAYAHKLLTERAKDFETKLRKFNGIGAFLKNTESEYDTFTTGHAGNSISLGLGLARARDIAGEKHEVISIVGDSSLTNGMNFEAMNDCGSRPTKHIVVLNDNDMSISKAVGAVSYKLTGLRQNTFYKKFKNKLINIVGFKRDNDNFIFLRKLKNSLKYMFTNGVLFEEFGYKYFGPVDGHNIGELVNIFTLAKEEKEPVMVHVVTKKGKGCKEAEAKPDVFHGVSDFRSSKNKSTTYSDIFGEKMVEIASRDEKVVAICAGMPDGVGLRNFSKLYPQRFYDVGIAEEHAVSMSAGLACGGLKPYVSIYSTFLQRSFDQIIHDVAIQQLPVRICVDRAGITGEDGETHQGIFDMSFLSMIPGLQIWSPGSKKEFEQMLEISIDTMSPLVIRYPKGSDDNEIFNCFKPGVWSQYGSNNAKIVLIASGAAMLKQCISASVILGKEDISTLILNASTIKPLDEDSLASLDGKKIIVVEDNVERGGLAEAISIYFQRNKKHVDIEVLNIGSKFVPQGSISILQSELGLVADKIVEKVREILNFN